MGKSISQRLAYHESLQLKVSQQLGTVWLEMRNYEQVLSVVPDEPDKTSIREQPVRLGAWPMEGEDAGRVTTADIAVMFDATAIIRMTRTLLDASGYFRAVAQSGSLQPTADKDGGLKLLKTALQSIGVSQASLDLLNFDDAFRADPGGSLENALKDEGLCHITPAEYQEFRKLDFDALFPRPDLIYQEERTKLIGMSGKTSLTDNRALSGVPTVAKMPPVDDAINAYMQQVDARRAEEMDTPESERAQELAERIKSGEDPKTARMKLLHAGMRRVCCYGFRGDARPPTAIKRVAGGTGGFLANITRTDAGIDKQKMDFVEPQLATRFGQTGTMVPAPKIGELIDNTLKAPKAKKGFFGRKKKPPADPLSDYFTVMRALNAFNLDLYIKKEAFRCFISATKSLAVAKAFSNFWAARTDTETWCYVLRCRGGYELPSHVDVFKDDDPNKPDPDALKKEHGIYKFFEQEVAVPGAVWWDDLAGFRKVVCNDDGQFLYGPVFLHQGLRERKFDVGGKQRTDRRAYKELFELLSGRSQGDDATIHKSYQEPGTPWEFKPNGEQAAPVANQGTGNG